MLRIGHISININTLTDNFGTVIHDWSFQQFLRKHGYSHTECINYVEDKYCKSIWGIRIPFYWYKTFRHIKSLFPYLIRYNRICRFYKKTGFAISRNCYLGSKDMDQKKLPYDLVICVSDVIWSLRGNSFSKPFYLASESMKGKKKIAFSPGLGTTDFTEEQKEEQKRWINDIEFVSCRGTFVAEYISQLTGRNIPALLDPVFLLDRNDYNKVAARKFWNRRYLLFYQPMQKNEYMLKSAVEFAKAHDLEVVEISVDYKKDSQFLRHQVLTASCEDFISAVRDADAIFTNSFHMVCFSIIYQKDFYCFARKYNSKTIDICETFDVKERFITDGEFREKKPIDYKSVHQIMVEQSHIAQTWLLDAIRSCEEQYMTE